MTDMDILDRLRALRGTAQDVGAVATAEIERLRKELAREQEEHNRCTTFHAIAVKERNHGRVLALKKDAEIERLRELLRSARDDVNECYNAALLGGKKKLIEEYENQLKKIDEALSG